jgi:hypothetical protein
LPRLSLGPRSARARLTASLLMLVVVAAVSVFVYALMPFRGQSTGNAPGRVGPSAPTMSSTALGSTPTSSSAIRPAGGAPGTSSHVTQSKADPNGTASSASSDLSGGHGK